MSGANGHLYGRKNFDLFSLDISKVPSRRRGDVFRTSTSLHRFLAPPPDRDQNKNQKLLTSYSKNFYSPTNNRENPFYNSGKIAKLEKQKFLKSQSNKLIPSTPSANGIMFKTTSQATYSDHGFRIRRPTKQPDRTNLRLEGQVDMTTESRRQYTSPWQKMFGANMKNEDIHRNSNNSSNIRATSGGSRGRKTPTRTQIRSGKAASAQTPRQNQEMSDLESETESEDEIVSESDSEINREEFEIGEKMAELQMTPRSNVIYLDTTVTTHK